MDSMQIEVTFLSWRSFHTGIKSNGLNHHNLVKNAVQSVPSDREPEINHCRDADFIYTRVQDNGEGIPMAMHKRVFEPNFTTKALEWVWIGNGQKFSGEF